MACAKECRPIRCRPVPGGKPRVTAVPPVSGAGIILVAEDLAMNRTLVSLMLRKIGYRVDEAADGAEALDAVRRHGYDLVLMDVQMPVMDGLEATRLIRALPAPAGLVPIIALTAGTQPADIAGYRDAGMDDFLAKPIDRTRLIAVVTRWIGAERR